VPDQALWWDFARIGAPSGQWVFVAVQPLSSGGGGPTAPLLPSIPLALHRYSSSGSFDVPAGTRLVGTPQVSTPTTDLGHPSVIGVWEESSRLMLGGFPRGNHGPGGVAVTPDIILISEPGDPTTYDDDARLALGVGDGERLMGICSWRDQTFMFKQTRMWVLTGISANSVGESNFHFRPVETGQVQGPHGPGAVCAARDGVYFANSNGVYRTTGNAPQLVSGDLGDLFLVLQNEQWYPNTQQVRLSHHDGRVFLTFGPAEQRRTFVYDIARKSWYEWTLPVAAFAPYLGRLGFLDVGFDIALGFLDPTIWLMDEDVAGDYVGFVGGSLQGQAIDWRWRSVPMDFGSPRVKRLTGSRITASVPMDRGLSLRVLSDYNTKTADSPELPVGLIGPHDVPEDGLVDGHLYTRYLRHGYHGRSFQIELRGQIPFYSGTPPFVPSACSGLQHLVHYVRGQESSESIFKVGGAASA
jgi:hypothetical protein